MTLTLASVSLKNFNIGHNFCICRQIFILTQTAEHWHPLSGALVYDCAGWDIPELHSLALVLVLFFKQLLETKKCMIRCESASLTDYQVIALPNMNVFCFYWLTDANCCHIAITSQSLYLSVDFNPSLSGTLKGQHRQTVQTRIRCHIMRHRIRVSTVC